jgi:hypothetical protein
VHLHQLRAGSLHALERPNFRLKRQVSAIFASMELATTGYKTLFFYRGCVGVSPDSAKPHGETGWPRAAITATFRLIDREQVAVGR